MFGDSNALWLRIFRERTSLPSSSVLGSDSNDYKECASDSIKSKNQVSPIYISLNDLMEDPAQLSQASSTMNTSSAQGSVTWVGS